MSTSEKDTRLAILQYMQKAQRAEHRVNLLGRPYQRGNLEIDLDVTFTPEERATAGRCLAWLEDRGYIEPTYNDVGDPLNWLQITERGRQALSAGLLDALDTLLSQIDPGLLQMRHGAWSALAAQSPDSLQQAAHSMRELLRMVLERLAPREVVAQAEWHREGRVTRKEQVRWILEERGQYSQSTASVIDASCELVDALYARLSGIAHHGIQADLLQQVSRLMRTAENALEELLSSANGTK